MKPDFIFLVRGLYLVREHLNGQKGQRINPDADNYIAYNWNDYCNDIGISRQTVNGWLRSFVPAELSASGRDEYHKKAPRWWTCHVGWDRFYASLPEEPRKRRAG